jgi:hypothetical protein
MICSSRKLCKRLGTYGSVDLCPILAADLATCLISKGVRATMSLMSNSGAKADDSLQGTRMPMLFCKRSLAARHRFVSGINDFESCRNPLNRLMTWGCRTLCHRWSLYWYCFSTCCSVRRLDNLFEHSQCSASIISRFMAATRP